MGVPDEEEGDIRKVPRGANRLDDRLDKAGVFEDAGGNTPKNDGKLCYIKQVQTGLTTTSG